MGPRAPQLAVLFLPDPASVSAPGTAVGTREPKSESPAAPLFACSAPNGRFYSSANPIATPRRIGPTMKAMGAVKTNRADLLTATDIDRSRSIASLVKESRRRQPESECDRSATRDKKKPRGGGGGGTASRDYELRANYSSPMQHGDRALRSFSPASSAWHPGKSEIVFCRNTSGGRASFYSVI